MFIVLDVDMYGWWNRQDVYYLTIVLAFFSVNGKVCSCVTVWKTLHDNKNNKNNNDDDNNNINNKNDSVD